jgi:broad specificity phosphatase PhoE
MTQPTERGPGDDATAADYQPAELLMVRHGESEGNIGKSTDPDCPLTERGLAQARTLARRLRGFDLSDFTGVTSPYRRAVQTAEALALELGVRFEVDEALREWGPAAVVGANAYPKEPVLDAVRRLEVFLRRSEGRSLLIVSHAAPIALLTQLAWGERPIIDGPFWAGVGNCGPRWVKTTCRV